MSALLIANCSEVPVASEHASITVAGIPRTYAIHFPAGYDPIKSTPLFILLHHRGGNGRGFAAASGMNEKSDRDNFIAVYPDALGTPSLWNASMAPDRADDVAFIRALISDLKNRHKISRAFIGGYSSGGYMTHTAGSQIEGVSGIAVVAGAMTGPPPQRSIPVVAFHGTQDSLVPFAAGKAAVEAWINVAAARPIERNEKENVVLEKSRGDGTSIDFYTLTNRGHSWPAEIYGKPTVDIIWEFFESLP